MTLAMIISTGSPLTLGSMGDAVRQTQLALKSLGYALTGTGYFGPATDTAVSAFQKRAGLAVDGDVGPLTASAIDRAIAGLSPAAASAQEIGRPLWLKNLPGPKTTP
jgi:peptidoglycan hydrolase-like protein with peptidoglycan-binding domain